jgi:hypothetical protein
MPVSTIRDLARPQGAYPGSPWRNRLLPARFDDSLFHVESGSREGGRRIVVHEFPKKEWPYAEDMGRKATEFTVRGYIIQFPYDSGIDLYSRDYTIARNRLQERLDTGGSGILQLPLQDPMEVVCTRYRMTEEERLGGYVTFDMQFVDQGTKPYRPEPETRTGLIEMSQRYNAIITSALAPKPNTPLPPIAIVNKLPPQFISPQTAMQQFFGQP